MHRGDDMGPHRIRLRPRHFHGMNGASLAISPDSRHDALEMNGPARFALILLLALPLPRARAGDPADFAQRWFDVAVAAEKAGKADEAKAAYVRVLEREPRHLEALVALARLDRAAQ